MNLHLFSPARVTLSKALRAASNGFLLAVLAASAPAQQLISDLQVQRSVRLGTLAAGVVSPAQITANQNDYAPTGFASAFALRVNSDAARSITGLAGGATGRMILLANVGSFAITLENADTNSTAANRFALIEDYALEPGAACWLYYDGTSSRWRQPGGGGGGAPAWGEITGTLSAQTDLQTALDAKVDEGAATASGLTMATARLLGRTTASTGAIEEISVAGSLSLSAGTLTGSGIVVGGTPALGDIAYWDGDSWERFARGTDGQVLKSNATTIVWGTDSTGSGGLPGTPTEGDLTYYDGADWISLPIGTAGEVLTVNGTADAPEWGAGGGGGTLTLARFTALDNQPPSSTYASFHTRNSVAVLDYDAGTDENAVFPGIIPEAASFTTGITARIHWMATSATSGDVVWNVAFERSNTDLDSDSFATAVAGTSTTNGTSGIVTVTSINFSGSEIDGLTAGDLFRVKVTRDADNGSDTMTGDAEFIALELRQR